MLENNIQSDFLFEKWNNKSELFSLLFLSIQQQQQYNKKRKRGK